MSLAAAAPLLRCPNCARPLEVTGGAAPTAGSTGDAPSALGCEAGHRFDVARGGHVSLFAPGAAPPEADTPAMVDARAAFLAAGHYDPLLEAVAHAATAAPPGPLVDLGAGPGTYLARALDARGGRPPGGEDERGNHSLVGIALDASRPALRRAARAHPRIAAVGCDVWRALPLADASVALVLDVFSPRNPAETERILLPGGHLLVVTPEPGHLAELRDAVPGMPGVEPAKRERLLAGAAALDHRDARTLTFPLQLDRAAAAALVAMGPGARHVTALPLDPPAAVTAAVRLDVFARR